MSSPQKRYLPVHRAKHVKVKVRDLRRVAEWNPSHPATKAFAQLVVDFPDDHEVLIGKDNLQAILDNREVFRRKKKHDTTDGPELTITRVGGKSYGPVPPNAPKIAGVNAPDDWDELDETEELDTHEEETEAVAGPEESATA